MSEKIFYFLPISSSSVQINIGSSGLSVYLRQIVGRPNTSNRDREGGRAIAEAASTATNSLWGGGIQNFTFFNLRLFVLLLFLFLS